MANKHWEALPDKGPQIGDDVPRHHRKREKRRFAIECRYIGPAVDASLEYILSRDWRVYRRYETKKAMQEAFATLTRKTQRKPKYYLHEYRMSCGESQESG